MPSSLTLASRAEALQIRLLQVLAQKQDAAARNSVETARARAQGSRVHLNAALLAVPDLRDRGVAIPKLSPPMKKEVTQARTALRTTATTLVGVDVGGLGSRVGAASVDGALALAEKVSKWLISELNKGAERERVRLLPAGIDDPIVAYPGVSELLLFQLGNAQTQLRAPVTGLAAEELGQRLDRIIEKADWWRLNRPLLDAAIDNHDVEIGEFLRLAATEAGAPWTLVTEKVRNWLALEDRAASFRITLRS